MFSDFDFPEDTQPTVTNNRMLGKFRPKKQTKMYKPIPPPINPSNASQSISPALDLLRNSSELLVTNETMNHSHSNALVVDGDKQNDFRSLGMEGAMMSVSSGLEPSAIATCEAAHTYNSFLLPITEEHVGSTEASVLDAASSGNDVDLQNDREQSGGVAAGLFSNVDSLDFRGLSNTTMVRAVGKFQPKVNAQSGGKKLTSPPSIMPGAADSIHASTLLPCSSVPIDASSASFINQEPAIHVEVSHAETEEVALPSDVVTVDDILVKPTATIDSYLICPNEVSEGVQSNSTLGVPFSKILMTEESVDNSLHSESMVPDGNRDLQMDHGRLEGEEEFPGFELLQDTFSQPKPDIARGMGKFQPKPNVRTKNVKPIAPAICDDDPLPPETESVGDHDTRLPLHSHVDSSTLWTRDSSPLLLATQHTVTRMQVDVSEFPSHDSASPSSNTNLQSSCKKLERDIISGRKRKPSAHAKGNVGKVQSQHVEFSQGVLDEAPILDSVEENRAGKSLRQLRKRKDVRSPVHEHDDTSKENSELENSNNSQMVDDSTDDEYIGEEMPRQKRATRNSKRLSSENEKQVRKRKKASEGPDPVTQETSKKFAHSTRRNRRRVDKILLETPEEDIDRANMRIKDLIMLAEFNERKSIREEAALKQSIPTQSASLSPNETSFDEENAFNKDQVPNLDNDEARHEVEPSSTKLNYHTYMTRTRLERWSKSDTEIFYQAVRQFGTDFEMIQQLFPNRTRHQVKLKFKNEERKHPLQISDALVHRSKDHSHFKLVIQRLQAQAEQNSNRDATSDQLAESTHASGENEEEESRSSDKKEEQEVNDWECGHSPIKPNEIQDVFDWNQYDTTNASFPCDVEKEEYDRF